VRESTCCFQRLHEKKNDAVENRRHVLLEPISAGQYHPTNARCLCLQSVPAARHALPPRYAPATRRSSLMSSGCRREMSLACPFAYYPAPSATIEFPAPPYRASRYAAGCRYSITFWRRRSRDGTFDGEYVRGASSCSFSRLTTSK